MLEGACFCGAARYRVADAFAYALNCHCSNCRRATGAAYKPIAGIARDHLTITRGADMIQRVAGSNGGWWSKHCRACCSLLYAVIDDASFVHVAMGTLIDAPSLVPTHHVFVGSKAPWSTITDDLPQYEHARPANTCDGS
jgi:hypothetical protein